MATPALSAVPRRFVGQAIVVTGAARGIGRAAAERFLSEGANVMLVDSDGDELARVQDELAAPDRLSSYVADVSDAAQVRLAILAAERDLGVIDVLINNAGIARQDDFLDIDEATWRRIVDVNLTGAFLVAQEVARTMVRNGVRGAIINTSSTNGLVGEPGYAHYNASKGGLTLLTKSMALDLASHGIRVNAVCPGYIRTPLSEAIDDIETVAGYVERFIPLGRAGEVNDVAGVFAFLASADAAFITGECIVVDGGQLAL